MSAPDDTDQPCRRGPRGRGAYLWLIEQIPDRYEPQLRDAATAVRNRRLRIRLFRERRIRRSRRAVRRSERAWQRRIRQTARTATRTAARTRLGMLQSRPNEQPAEEIAWTPRGRISRAVFRATVRFPGDGEFVVIDATGHLTSDIVACQDRLPQRFLVVTDAPSVGALRAAGMPYEYLPTASANHCAETFRERLLWLDYVYGVDRIERLDHYFGESPDDTEFPTNHAIIDQ